MNKIDLRNERHHAHSPAIKFAAVVLAIITAVLVFSPQVVPFGEEKFVYAADGSYEDEVPDDGFYESEVSVHFFEKSARFQGPSIADEQVVTASVQGSTEPVNCRKDDYFAGLPMPTLPLSAVYYRSVAFDVATGGEGCPKITGFAVGKKNGTGSQFFQGVKWIFSNTSKSFEGNALVNADYSLSTFRQLIPFNISPLGDVLVGKELSYYQSAKRQQYGFIHNEKNGTTVDDKLSRLGWDSSTGPATVACYSPSAGIAGHVDASTGTVEAVGYGAWVTVNLTGATPVQCLWPGSKREAIVDASPKIPPAPGETRPLSEAVDIAYRQKTKVVLLNEGASLHTTKILSAPGGTQTLTLPGNAAQTYGEALSDDGRYAAGSAEVSMDGNKLWRGVIWDALSSGVTTLAPDMVSCSPDETDTTGCGQICPEGEGCPVSGNWFRDVANNGAIAVGSIRIPGVSSDPLTDCSGQTLGTEENISSATASSMRLRAAVYTPGLGLIRLEDLIGPSFKGDLTGWELCEATGISPDGTAITGVGIHNGRPEAFVVHLAIADDLAVMGQSSFGMSTQDFAVADFDGDGYQDLAALNDYQKISIAYGRADGGYDDPYTSVLPEEPEELISAIESGDFDENGAPDLIVANRGSNITVWKGTTSKPPAGDTFVKGAVYQIGLLNRPRHMVTADFNGDRHLDLAVTPQIGATRGASPTLYILLGQGDGTFAAPYEFGLGSWYDTSLQPYEVIATDLDKDGDPDLAIAHFPGTVSVIKNNCTIASGCSFEGRNIPRLPNYYASSIGAGDFDGDGNVDLVIANLATLDYPQNDVVIYYGDPITGQFGARREVSPSWPGGPAMSDSARIVVEDMNGDGLSDIVLADYYSGKVRVLIRAITEAGPSGFYMGQIFELGSGAKRIRSVDLNGDSRKDIAVSTDAGQIMLYRH